MTTSNVSSVPSGAQKPAADATRVSIIVPTYRRARRLEVALRSLLDQNAPPDCDVEIVVVENSPDGEGGPVVDALRKASPVALHYVTEPRRGISHARNSGVGHASGDVIVFLDDDQSVPAGWLEALVGSWRSTGADGVFGPIEAVFESGAGTRREKAYFGLDLPIGDGAEIEKGIARLGTRNALLERSACLPGAQPFDVGLGQIGGEDSVLFRTLRLAGRRFAWSARALAFEHVPASRQSWRYIALRRFRSGQIRTLACLRAEPARPLQAAFWMLIGAGEATVYAAAALVTSVWSRGEAAHFAGKMCGGIGKIVWFPPFRFKLYGRKS